MSSVLSSSSSRRTTCFDGAEFARCLVTDFVFFLVDTIDFSPEFPVFVPKNRERRKENIYLEQYHSIFPSPKENIKTTTKQHHHHHHFFVDDDVVVVETSSLMMMLNIMLIYVVPALR